MKNRSLRHDCSGQVIVITALLVALVLLSTAIFVIETEKDVPTVADASNVFPSYKQALMSTLISALANVTNGGAPSVLSADLNELKSAIASNSFQSILQMNFTTATEDPYQNGVGIQWGANGQGMSSACVTVEIESTGTASVSTSEYVVDVTSEVYLSGSYLQLDNNSTQVNLIVNVQNEGAPALAQNLSFYYENATKAWTKANPLSLNDFGNGTYSASFTSETAQSFFPLQVSAVCQDQRGIVVVANATCTESG